MDGKRTPVDFDKLKIDLRELGSSLRAGFEEAKEGFKHGVKNTSRLRQQAVAGTASTPEHIRRQVQEQVESTVLHQERPLQPIPVRLKRVRGGSSRRYSLAHATLGIFGGAAGAGVMYYVLQTAEASGLLSSIERSIIAEHPQLLGFTGMAATMKSLWALGLLPAVKGVAHLLNAILFPAKPEPDGKEIEITVPYTVKVTAVSKLIPAEVTETYAGQRLEVAPAPSTPPERDTNEFYAESVPPPVSVVEEETVRFSSEGKS